MKIVVAQPQRAKEYQHVGPISVIVPQAEYIGFCRLIMDGGWVITHTEDESRAVEKVIAERGAK
jgi:hypothetical protein